MILSKDALYILQLQKLEEDGNGDLSLTNNLKLGLDTTAASGTIDGDLYAAIQSLGWANDVIE